jgi:hypothetical protein
MSESNAIKVTFAKKWRKKEIFFEFLIFWKTLHIYSSSMFYISWLHWYNIYIIKSYLIVIINLINIYIFNFF